MVFDPTDTSLDTEHVTKRVRKNSSSFWNSNKHRDSSDYNELLVEAYHWHAKVWKHLRAEWWLTVITCKIVCCIFPARLYGHCSVHIPVKCIVQNWIISTAELHRIGRLQDCQSFCNISTDSLEFNTSISFSRVSITHVPLNNDIFVRPPVRHAIVSCLTGRTCHQTFFITR